MERIENAFARRKAEGRKVLWLPYGGDYDLETTKNCPGAGICRCDILNRRSFSDPTADALLSRRESQRALKRDHPGGHLDESLPCAGGPAFRGAVGDSIILSDGVVRFARECGRGGRGRAARGRSPFRRGRGVRR